MSSMVSVLGRTYRIVPVSSGTYAAVRLLDDARIGTFDDGPSFRGTSAIGGDALLRRIAETAIRFAKTHWTPRPSR